MADATWRSGTGLCVALLMLASATHSQLNSSHGRTDDPLVRVATRTRTGLSSALIAELDGYGEVTGTMPALRIAVMCVPASKLHALEAHPAVEYVERDREFRLTGLPPVSESDFVLGISPWVLDVIDVTDSALNPDPFWSGPASVRVVEETGDGVYVAVLDSGMWSNWRDFFPEERIDQVHATSFTGGSIKDPPRGTAAATDERWDKDTDGHGTAVAAVICGYRFSVAPAIGGGAGIPPFNSNGAAPRATIIPVKVLGNNNSGSTVQLVAGIHYVANLRASGEISAPIVINMSLGGFEPSPSVEAAIDYAIEQGVVVVASAGNDGAAGMGWPGAFPQVISVGATGLKNEWSDPTGDWIVADIPEETSQSVVSFLANFSSRERDDLVPGRDQELDVLAPGSAVFLPGPVAGAASPDGFHQNQNYNFSHSDAQHSRVPHFTNGSWYGTSFAAPHVAGVAALILQKNPSLTQADVESILKSTAIPIEPGSHVGPSLIEFVHQKWTFGDSVESVWGASPEEQGSGLVQAEDALAATPQGQ